MPKYAVTFLNTMSHTVEVEAENQEAAIDKAYDEGEFPTPAWDWPDTGDWTFGGEWPGSDEDDYVEEIG